MQRFNQILEALGLSHQALDEFLARQPSKDRAVDLNEHECDCRCAACVKIISSLRYVITDVAQ
jgi:hypothetical protein